MVVTVSHHPKQIAGGCMFSVLIGRSRLGIGTWNILDASKGFWSKGSWIHQIGDVFTDGTKKLGMSKTYVI